MKKIFLLFSLLSSLGMTFAYTSNDVGNATYLADQGVVVRQTTDIKYRLDDRVLRQEIIGMALNIKGVPLPENYTCKKYFSDATKNDWVCRALEIAADNGMITRANIKARPTDFVTRAEALAILLKTGKVSLTSPRRVVQTDGSVWSLYQDLQGLGFTQWQADMMDSLPGCLIINHGISCEDGASTNTSFSQFRPNVFALRSEVFEFSALISGFIAGDSAGGALDDLDILLPSTTVSASTDQNYLTSTGLKDLLRGEPVQTVSTSPTVALIVFSDFECPFCVKLFQDVVTPIITDASTNTALIYKHYPLAYHANAFIWAVESECVAKNLGSVAFFDYVHKRYADQNASISALVPDLTPEQMTACRLTDDTISQNIAAEQALGALYEVNGTPTTLVVNTRTGYYKTIVGAQSKIAFNEVIQTVKDHQ